MLVHRRLHPAGNDIEPGNAERAQALAERPRDLPEALVVCARVDELMKLLVQRGEFRGIVARGRFMALGIAAPELVALHLRHPLRTQACAETLEFAEGFEHIAQ